MDVPGFGRDGIHVAWDDGVLNVSADHVDRERGREETCHRRFRLPDPVEEDGIAARYTNGVLEVSPRSSRARPSWASRSPSRADPDRSTTASRRPDPPSTRANTDGIVRRDMAKVAGITDDAVEGATGEGWSHWLGLLDDHGGTDLDHKQRVAVLADAGIESPWWQQQVAVGYERERGLREVGETADAGFQVGVQRTLPIEQGRLWSLITDEPGLSAWLGAGSALRLEPGAGFETDDGVVGEVRTVSAGERLRLTWQPADRDAPTTLQVTAACPRNDESRTVLRIHHERLADADEREAMRGRWTGALDEIVALVREPAGG